MVARKPVATARWMQQCSRAAHVARLAVLRSSQAVPARDRSSLLAVTFGLLAGASGKAGLSGTGASSSPAVRPPSGVWLSFRNSNARAAHANRIGPDESSDTDRTDGPTRLPRSTAAAAISF